MIPLAEKIEVARHGYLDPPDHRERARVIALLDVSLAADALVRDKTEDNYRALGEALDHLNEVIL